MQALIAGSLYVYGARQFYKKDKKSYDTIFLKDVKHPGRRPSFSEHPTTFSRYLDELEAFDDAERCARGCAFDRSLVWPVAMLWDTAVALGAW